MNYIYEDDIIARGKELEEKTLLEYLSSFSAMEIDSSNAYNTGKGSLGQLVEEFVFEYKPNSRREADFNEFDMELKVVPIKRIIKQSKSGMKSKLDGYSVKERMVLSIINYEEIINETWQTNSLNKKMLKLLLMFYLHENDVDVKDLVFKLVEKWEPSDSDLAIIKNDWELIVAKIRSGRAHELSEGDTFFLGACTKGATKSSLRKQPNSDELAMQRAFSLKRNFVDEIFNELYTKQKSHDATYHTITETVSDILLRYKGHSMSDILASFKCKHINSKAKNRLSLITLDLMGNSLGITFKQHEQVIKAGLELKTIFLKPNGIPKEAMSFEQIDYNEIVNQEWDSSDVKSIFESKKHIWVIYQSLRNYTNQSELRDNEYILKDVMIWNMPVADLEGPYRQLWEDTVLKVKEMRFKEFWGQSDNEVGHIRPKAKDSNDTTLFNGYQVPKKCFWLNTSYISKQIEIWQLKKE